IASAPSEALELQAVASAAASSSGSRRATRRPGEGNRRSMFIVDTSWWRGGGDGVEQRPRRAHVACGKHVAGGGAVRADAVERCGGGGRAGNDCGSRSEERRGGKGGGSGRRTQLSYDEARKTRAETTD